MSPPPILRRLGAALLLLAFLMSAAPARAAAPATPAGTPTVEQLQALVATLEDPDERARLVQQLQGLIAAQQKQQATVRPTLAETMLAGLSTRIDRMAGDTVEVVRFLIDLPRLYGWFERLVMDPERRASLIDLLRGVVFVLGAGILAELVVRRLLRRPRQAVAVRPSRKPWERVFFLAARVLIALLPLLAFTAVAYGVLPLIDMRSSARYAVLDLIVASVMARAIVLIAWLVFSPETGGNRLLPITPETAGYLYVWVRRIAYLTIYGWFVADALRYVGLPIGAYAMLLRLIGLGITGLLVVMILQNRVTIGSWIAGAGKPARLGAVRARLGEVWHILAIVYVVGIYLVWALDVQDGFGFVFRATAATVLVIVLARLLLLALEHGLRRAFSVGEQLEAQYPGLEARANRYLPIVRTGFTVVIYLVAALAILQAWGANSFGWISSQTGARVVGSGARILLLLLATLVGWEMLTAAIERYMNRTDAAGLRLADRSARARTLMPLLRTTLAIALVIVTALMVLSEVGLDIAPLLAGAGILGVAIGFGSQTLVKDVITGFFILVEDTISVGDVIDVGGGNSGSVEAITIRTIKLRNINSTLLTIPFSQVSTIRNMTKLYAHAVLDLGVAYREEHDRVMEVLTKAAESVTTESEVADLCLPPAEVQGPLEFKDSAVIYRVRIKTLPGKHWAVSRELNKRVKAACDAAGIEIPFPHQTIYFGVDRAGNAPPARVMLENAPAPQPPASPAAGPPLPPPAAEGTPG